MNSSPRPGDGVRVPASNLFGAEGTGFFHLVDKLPQERLSTAVAAMAAAEAAFGWTLTHAKERQAFGRPIGRFQHNRFVLAEMRTQLDLGWAFVDRQIEALNDGTLTAEDAAEAKWSCTEMQGGPPSVACPRRVVDVASPAGLNLPQSERRARYRALLSRPVGTHRIAGTLV